jgi:hypothetical protein
VDHRAAAAGGRAQPPGVSERVETEPVTEPDRAVGGRPPKVALGVESRAVEELDAMVPELLPVERAALAKLGHGSGRMGDVDVPLGRGLAVDRLGGDETAHGLERLEPDGNRPPRGREPPPADALGEPDLSERHGDEAAIPPTGAPADPVRLEDDGLDAIGAGEAEGGRKAGVARADDGDLGRALTSERREGFGLGARGVRPVGRRLWQHASRS